VERGGRWEGAREGGPPPIGRYQWPTLNAYIGGWVTAGELPDAPPPPLPLGAEVPVALWRDDEVVAVLSIAHTGPMDYLGKGPSFHGNLYLARRALDGWVVNDGAMGSGWPVAYGERPEGDLPALAGGQAGEEPPDAVAAHFAAGIAPPGMDQVEVDLGGGDLVTVPVEPVSGAFLLRVPTRDWIVNQHLPLARPDERLLGTPDPAELDRRLDWLGVPRRHEPPGMGPPRK
jgi:hypothetical protein